MTNPTEREKLVAHAKQMRDDLSEALPNGVGNTIDALLDLIEAQAAEIARLRATVERVRAAIEFVEPRDRAELDAALASDIAAGMSLRKAATKHGTTLSIARTAIARAALNAAGERP